MILKLFLIACKLESIKASKKNDNKNLNKLFYQNNIAFFIMITVNAV
jgi:hypothetical protein